MTPQQSRRRARGWVLVGLVAVVGEAFVWHYSRTWFFLVGSVHLIAFIEAALRYGWARGYMTGHEDGVRAVSGHPDTPAPPAEPATNGRLCRRCAWGRGHHPQCPVGGEGRTDG